VILGALFFRQQTFSGRLPKKARIRISRLLIAAEIVGQVQMVRYVARLSLVSRTESYGYLSYTQCFHRDSAVPFIGHYLVH